jgi:alkylation response protein AidB-like acyl-CoA dehydrogenase
VIDLELDDDQRAVADVADASLGGLARHRITEVDDARWRALAEIGMFALGLPEEAGGAGFGTAGEILVAEALGRHLAPVGLLAPLVALQLLDGDEGTRAAVRDGDARVAFASPLELDRWVAVDLHGADLVVLLGGGGAVAERADFGVVRAISTLDDGAELVEVTGPATPGVSGRGAERAELLFAAACVGVAGAVTDLAVEHAQSREQFGVPIGTFQAVKHRCVDMTLRHQAALAAVRMAAVRDDATLPCDPALASAALVARDAARVNAASAIQVFGGIGFTVEGGIQRHLHRAWLLDRLLGPPDQFTERLVEGVAGS